MSGYLDISFDDIVNKNNSERGRRRGRGQDMIRRGVMHGGSFSSNRMTRAIRTIPRAPLSVKARPSSHTTAKSISRMKSFPWQNDLFEDSLRASGISGIESGTKLRVSNLDYGVSNKDIRELFSEIGELKQYAIHFNNDGRPSGSAEVVYLRKSEAFAAFKRYNNVQLDGRPMKIQIISPELNAPFPAFMNEAPLSARVNVIGGVNGTRTVIMRPGRIPFRGRPAVTRGFRRGMVPSGGPPEVNYGNFQKNRGGGSLMGRGRGGGRGRGKTQRVETSADDLDKELDNYHAEAMQT